MGKNDHCKTCSSAGPGGCSSQECADDKALLGCFNDIKNVIVVMSGKGGVGKSSVASLLATALNQQGYKVGVLDADITGPSIPKAFGLNGAGMQASTYGLIPPQSKSGVKVMSINLLLPREDEPVIWRGPLLAGAVNQFWSEVDWRELDFLVVDMPPGTGDVPLTVLQSLPVTGLVIVTSPQDLVTMVVKKTIKMAQKLNVRILGLVENMAGATCPHCGERLELFGEPQGGKVAAEQGIPLLAQVPWDLKLNQLMDEGRIEEYDQPVLTMLADNLKKQLDGMDN